MGGTAAGGAVGLFVFSLLVGRLFAGRFLETMGRKRMFISSGLACALITIPYYFDLPLTGLYLVLTLHGLLYGVCTNTIIAIGSDIIPRSRFSEGLGFMSISASFAHAAGSFVGLRFLNAGMEPAFFALFTVCSLVGVVLFLPVRSSDINSAKASSELSAEEDGLGSGNNSISEEDNGFIWRYIDKNALPASLAVILCSFCYAGLGSFLSPYYATLGLADAVPWYFLVFSACLIVSRPIAGRMQDSYGDKAVFIPMLALYLAVPFVCLLAQNVIGLIVTAVLMAFGHGALFSCLSAVAVRRSLGKRIGVATSTFCIASDFGGGIGPVLLGMVVESSGYPAMFFCMTAVIVALIVYCFLVVLRVKPNTGKNRL